MAEDLLSTSEWCRGEAKWVRTSALRRRPVSLCQDTRACRSGGQMPGQPGPRFRLHLRVELVGRVVETRAHVLGDARLGVARGELVEAGADAREIEQRIPAAVDDQ